LAHLKTFAKWIHKFKPLPLGNTMTKMKLMPIGNSLAIERAISPTKRRRILDAADTLPIVGGRSKDRHRFRDKERPMRKGYRPFRNRAIVYTLIETGMRRAAVQRQLGHTNPAYSMQYTRITDEELGNAVEDR
jgi:hypothetical protein